MSSKNAIRMHGTVCAVLLVLEQLERHSALHIFMLFRLFALFLRVLEELGMHSGLHIFMLFTAFALFWVVLRGSCVLQRAESSGARAFHITR